MLLDEGRGMLLSYRPCMVDESEVGKKAGHKKESRKGAFDHHDTLET
jgi:hypothetical protein